MSENKQPYNSEPDTLKHIKRVNELLLIAAQKLIQRAIVHDESKLSEPEKSMYDELTPLLAGSTYGSDEYEGFMVSLRPALDNHYAKNSHHPQHYENGVNDMDLFDLIEMFFDWKAAGERHANGDIFESIKINTKRFRLSEQVVAIMINTAERMF